MAKRNTKQIILEQALNLFATNGYEKVTIRDIAGAVMIRESSIYKHYKSKQEIFNSILAETKTRYENTTIMLGISGDVTKVTPVYSNFVEEDLVKVAIGLFTYFTEDDFEMKTRKMFTTQQFKNSEVAEIYAESYLYAPIKFQSELFAEFIEQGIMRKVDPEIAAMHFYTPIFNLINRFDNSPQSKNQSLEIITRHIHQFNLLYME